MKIELKNIKHSEFASHETFCYEANLYVEGKPFAYVRNDGQGGSDHFEHDPRFKDLDAWKKCYALLNIHCAESSDGTWTTVLKLNQMFMDGVKVVLKPRVMS